MKVICRKTNILVIFLFLFLQGYAQKSQRIEKNGVVGFYKVESESSICLEKVQNKRENKIRVMVDGAIEGIYIGADESKPIGKICGKYVKFEDVIEGSTYLLWRTGDTAGEWLKLHPVEVKEVTSEEKGKAADVAFPVEVRNKKVSAAKNTATQEVGVYSTISVDSIVSVFLNMLEKDPFYSSLFVQACNEEMEKHSKTLSIFKDKESRDDYIKAQNLWEYYEEQESEINRMEGRIDAYVTDFISSNFSANSLPNRKEYETRLRNILEEKIAERRSLLEEFLDNILNGESFTTIVSKRLFSGKSIAINIVVSLAGVCLVILIALLVRRGNKKKREAAVRREVDRQSAQKDIVVRRKTTSILKKQSLEDVQHNDEYLKIDCVDFCEDSAVRRIYLKNTCIKDIYNLYAEDLRNPANPNEDGCMVLGRWVHDEQNDEYYVSLEEIVKPGDDAVFKEYELNFGGKIKLKVSEKLRRLRRETNLQYDMTCWVHSHPGLGVFFSNADSSVQMQLKHPTHPKFLIAMVIDILTPEQEMGIFTFKHDLSINSKTDLKRMYSLEELYKWAVESDRASFKPEDYRNIMQNASKRTESHYGVELSNGAIIDMCQLQANHESGLLAWVHGYAWEKNGKTEYILKSVSLEKSMPDSGVLGCYINGSHCSIPTIKRLISDDLKNMKFILFYSTSEDVLTSIPVVDGQLAMDENYYGEEKLEELKIWTRRRR